MKNNKKKILLVASGGGHFEELKALKPLLSKYDGIVVTEKTDYETEADYSVVRTGLGDKGWIKDTVILFRQAFKICKIEKPNFIITTGTYVALPFLIYCKFTGGKFIFIESIARITDTTKAGRVMYHFSDLFIYQWPELEKYYSKGVYGGSIF